MTRSAGATGSFIERRLVNRDFARLWTGGAVSGLGDAVFDTTVLLWIATVLAHGRSWGPAAVSGVVLAAGLAVAVVGPIAGVFADRWEWRATMLRTEVIRAVLAGVLTAMSLLPTRDLPVGAWLALVYGVVLALNVAGQFFNPSRFAMISQIVPGDEDRAKAVGLSQGTYAATLMIGPPLAAPLLFTVGFRWALLFNAASYVFSFWVIRSVRVERAARTPAMSLASMLSLAVSGWLASTVLLNYHGEIGGLHMGRIDLIFTAGAALVTLGGVYGGIFLPRDAESPRGVSSGRAASRRLRRVEAPAPR